MASEEIKNNNGALVDSIFEHAKADEVIFWAEDGAHFVKLEDFVNQPVDGILYDLNRDLATLSTTAKNSKSLRFVNDFAAAYTIKYLYKKVTELTEEKNELQKRLDNTIKELNRTFNSLMNSKPYIEDINYNNIASTKSTPFEPTPGMINTDFSFRL